MGMYDTIWVKCPQCKSDVDFQSKSGECILGQYEIDNCPDDVMLDANRHSPVQCDCGALLEIDRINRSVIINGAAGEKIKVSSHQTDLQGANSGQLQQHNVGRSLPTDEEINDMVMWLDKRCGFDDHQKDYVFFGLKQMAKKVIGQ